GAQLGLQGERIHRGVELSALRSTDRELAMAQGRILLGIDASGMVDTRGINRADTATQSGLRLADFIAGPRDVPWRAFAWPLIERIKAPDPRWHASRGTGYVEESAASSVARE